MLFFIVFAIALVVGFIVTKKTNKTLDSWNLLGTLLLVFGTIAFLGACIMLPICRNNTVGAIDIYNATKTTIVKARESGTVEERSTLAEVLIQTNASIAEARHDNESLWFDWFIDDDFVALPPLE